MSFNQYGGCAVFTLVSLSSLQAPIDDKAISHEHETYATGRFINFYDPYLPSKSPTDRIWFTTQRGSSVLYDSSTSSGSTC